MLSAPTDPRIESAVAALAASHPSEYGWTVVTPLIFPSGASVTVNAAPFGSSYTVSDVGCGFDEAYSMDVPLIFARAAKEMAGDMGLIFDRHRIAVHEVNASQLAGAITLVANCSLASVILAVDRAQQRRATERTEAFVGRLRKIFNNNVAEGATVPGASNTEWTVDALVKSNDKNIVFDFVTSNQNSVTSTSAKFHDFALMSDPPRRCATVASKSDLGTLLSVLAQAGDVIEDRVPDSTLMALAA